MAGIALVEVDTAGVHRSGKANASNEALNKALTCIWKSCLPHYACFQQGWSSRYHPGGLSECLDPEKKKNHKFIGKSGRKSIN